MKQINIFAETKAYELVDKLGDPLQKLDAAIDWTPFVRVIEEVRPDNTKTGAGGRPPLSSKKLFKCLLLGEINNLSDEMLEYMITDRLSFMRFVGLSLDEKSPDRNTFWLLREKLKQTGKYDDLFKAFWEMLEKNGIVASKGVIVDATFVDAPRRRAITREEIQQLKNGEIPARLGEPESVEELHFSMQVDTDASWAKKGGETHFGYKDHIAVDAETKLILKSEVTTASVHDSQKLADVVPECTEEVWDDAGYVGEDIDRKLHEKCPEVQHNTCKKGYRNQPLTDEEKENNREISRTRSRVEHVFGRQTTCMGGLTIRLIGLARAKCQIKLRDLAYNLLRYATLVKLEKMPALGQ